MYDIKVGIPSVVVAIVRVVVIVGARRRYVPAVIRVARVTGAAKSTAATTPLSLKQRTPLKKLCFKLF